MSSYVTKELASNELLQALVNNTSEVIITVDTEGIVQSCNQACQKTFGYLPEEIIGSNIKMLMPEPYYSKNDSHIEYFTRKGNSNTIDDTPQELKAMHKDGTVLPVELTVTKILIGDDTFFTSIIHSISERKEIEKKLLFSILEAEKANSAKSDFLANMSHELRTPINAIIGMLQLLLEDKGLGKETLRTIGIICRSSQSLLKIVNDILDLSKIEAGEIKIESFPFSIDEVYQDISEELSPVARQRGLILKIEKASAYDGYLAGDPFKLRRIIINLIDNALKYTEEGLITVSYDLRPLEGDIIELFCDITDTGIGIASNKLEAVFDKFSQSDISDTRKYGGTGLGLSITKELIELMGGNISVKSQLGVGSTFSVYIPFKTAKRDENSVKTLPTPKEVFLEPVGKEINIRQANILVAEDHRMNQAYMTMLMERWNVGSFYIADTGNLVLEALKTTEYDLILMDCHMPNMNGYETTQAIRLSELSSGKHIPIIALTADAMSGTKEKCLNAGMDAYISKPADPSELKLTLMQWLTFDNESYSKPMRECLLNEPDIIDLQTLKNYAVTEQALENLLSTFITQSDDALDTLKRQCTEGENKEWSETAHKLKGGAAFIGAEILETLCSQAEDMIRSSKKEREDMLTNIIKSYQEVKDRLTSRPYN